MNILEMCHWEDFICFRGSPTSADDDQGPGPES